MDRVPTGPNVADLRLPVITGWERAWSSRLPANCCGLDLLEVCSEVTALGDEVNEAARIEACATGGLLLASKPLIERLTDDDAATLGVDPGHVDYTPLGNLTTATEKARRDAPAIAVCEL